MHVQVILFDPTVPRYGPLRNLFLLADREICSPLMTHLWAAQVTVGEVSPVAFSVKH